MPLLVNIFIFDAKDLIMIKQGVFILLLCLPGLLDAQDKMLTVNIDGSTGVTNLVFFKQYAEAYNKALEPQLASELGNMKWSYGYSYGLTFHSGALYLEFDNDNKYGHTSAKQVNEAIGTRHIRVRHNIKSIQLGYVTDLGGAYFTIGTIFGIDNIFLDSYRKYPSGDISYGAENNTNGKYKGQNLMLGMKTNVNFPLTDRLFLNAGVKLMFSAFNLMDRDIREINDKRGFYFPGMVYTTGIPSLTRGFDIHLGLHYAIFKK